MRHLSGTYHATTLGLTVFQAAHLRAKPLCEPDQLHEGLPLHKVDMLTPIMSGAPSIFVDIEPALDLRMRAAPARTAGAGPARPGAVLPPHRRRPRIRQWIWSCRRISDASSYMRSMCWGHFSRG